MASSHRRIGLAMLACGLAFVAGVLATGCSAAHTNREGVGTDTSRVIFGTDDRKNIVDVLAEPQKVRWADSVAMLAVSSRSRVEHANVYDPNSGFTTRTRPLCAMTGLFSSCYLDTAPLNSATLPDAPKHLLGGFLVPRQEPLCASQQFVNERISTNAFCTAFFVGGRRFVTAGHCIFDKNQKDSKGNASPNDADEPTCDGSKKNLAVVFDFKMDGLNPEGTGYNDPRAIPMRDIYYCKTLVGTSYYDETAHLDIQVFDVERDVIGHLPLVVDRTLASGEPKDGTNVVGIGYGLGLPEKVTNGVVRDDSTVFSTTNTVDAFAGKSGGPLITSSTGFVTGVLASSPSPSFTLDSSGTCLDYRTCDEANGCAGSVYTRASEVPSDLFGYIPGPGGYPALFRATLDLDGDGLADNIVVGTATCKANFLDTCYTLDVKLSGAQTCKFCPIDTGISSTLFSFQQDQLESFLHVSDFNNDGYLDLAVAVPGVGNAYIDGKKSADAITNALTGPNLFADAAPFLSLGAVSMVSAVSLKDRNGDGVPDFEGITAGGRTQTLFGMHSGGTTSNGLATSGGLTPAVRLPDVCGTAPHYEDNYPGKFPGLTRYQAPRAVAVVPGTALGIFSQYAVYPTLLAVDCPGSAGTQNRISFIDPLTGIEVERVNVTGVAGSSPEWRSFAYRADSNDLLALSDDAAPATPYVVYKIPLKSGPLAATKLFSRDSTATQGIATGVGWDANLAERQVKVSVDQEVGYDFIDTYSIDTYPQPAAFAENFIDPDGACALSDYFPTGHNRTALGGLAVSGKVDVLACLPVGLGIGNFNRRAIVTQAPLDKGTAVSLFTTMNLDETASINGQWGMAMHDIECDPLTYALQGKTVIWAMSRTGRVVRAYPVPAASCGLGGVKPVASACLPPQDGVHFVAAGGASSFYASSDGIVRASGDNAFGQLGIGSATDQTRPVVVDGYAGAKSLAAGSHHSLAVTADGSVLASGDNSHGQLGREDIASSSTPVSVPGLPPVVTVAAGDAHSLALDAQGHVWAWGANDRGQLGDGTLQSTSTATPVTGFGSLTGSFIQSFGSEGSGPGQFDRPIAIAAGFAGIFVADLGNRIQRFDQDGNFVLEWGGFGTGDGQFTFSSGVALVTGEFPEVYVADAATNRVQKFAPDGTFITRFGGTGTGPGQFSTAFAIDASGSGDVYVLDLMASQVQRFVFADLASSCPTGTQEVAAVGSERTCFVDAWGEAGTGTGQIAAGARGIAVDSTTSDVFVLDSGNNRVLRFTSAGAFVAAWGSAGTGDGQFLDASGIDVGSSGRVYVTDDTRDDVQIFSTQGAFLGKFGMPGSAAGQLDQPAGVAVLPDETVAVADTANDRVSQFEVTGTAPVAAIAAGKYHSLAITTDGGVWAWGANDQGQLGNGILADSPVPVRVLLSDGTPLTDVTRVSGGGAHSLAATLSGQVMAWGANDHGQLGNGTTTDRSYADVVGGVSYATDVAAGDAFSLALTGDGRVSSWGDNSRGQLGTGTTTASLVPATVRDPCDASGALEGVKEVVAGAAHAVANGSLVAWGAGDKGQIGDGSSMDRPYPTPIRFTTAPDCAAAAASPATLKPANHGLRTVAIDGVTTSTGSPATIQIEAVTQDEPTTGTGQGPDEPDAFIAEDGTTVQLRSERAGTGDGRVYHVGFTATDDTGSECRGDVTVCVPHDAAGTCTDAGDLFDSTQTALAVACGVAPSSDPCEACMGAACCDDLIACNTNASCGGPDGEMRCIERCLAAQILSADANLAGVLPVCADQCARGPHLAHETSRLIQCIATPDTTGRTCATACWGDDLAFPGATTAR